MNKTNYHPEPYWSKVAERINSRAGKNVIAGDDEPYYRYKRKRFLELLHSIDFEGKKVLEVGSGPGGNLKEIAALKPKVLHGVDISKNMIALASSLLADEKVQLTKINGQKLPFEDNFFDIIFTATVLQHNTDEQMMQRLLAEICRVSGDTIVLFERIDKTIQGDELCKGRPVSYYSELCAAHNFKLEEVEFINIHASYLYCGAIRKGLNSTAREEGEPLNKPSVFLQNIGLPVTSFLDKVFPKEKDVAKMVFRKTDS